LKQHLIRIALGIGVLIFFLGHAAEQYRVGFVEQLDQIIYDTRLKVSAPRKIDDRIIILDIDEKSLARLGRWPWSRDKMAQLIDTLFNNYGVSLIGFDVVFAEPDTSSGIASLEALSKQGALKDNDAFKAEVDRLRPTLDYDARFAKSLSGRPIVLGFYFSSLDQAEKSGALPQPVLPSGAFKGRDILWAQWQGFGGNLPQLQKNVLLSGSFNPFLDGDGVVRKVPMLLQYNDQYYEALSLAMFRALLGMPKVEPGYPEESVLNKRYGGLEWLEFNAANRKWSIPVDRQVAALVPYRGKGGPDGGSFKYISLADVWDGKVAKKDLEGKLAFWGTTAPGLKDLRSTPMGGDYPGVEIHANLLSGMLSQNFKSRPAFVIGAEVVLLSLGGIALALLMPFLSPLRATLVAVAGLIGIVLVNWYTYSAGDVVLPLAASLLMTLALFTLNMAYGYFVESRSKREFTALFGQYVPPELVDEMARDPTKYSMEPTAAELTILFSDVRGFTTISESLSPADLASYINDYLTGMSAVISSHRGTLDKYIGDAVMAFWGAPVPDAEHARQGVITALEMQKVCSQLDAKFSAKGWPALRIGIGLNSGNVRVGDMGSKVRKAYTVMGDPVNLASRLEGRTKEYSVGILVGEATQALVKDVVFKELDRIRVKGKNEPVAIYEPLCMESELSKELREEIKIWRDALKAYRSQNWDQVEMNLLNLQRMNPDCGLYEQYGRRVVHYRRNPPGPSWDGVTNFDEK
jgi:adenylate cyclase